MATGLVELLEYVNENVLECVICTERFEQPKSLPCLHVFCRGCIKGHIDRNVTDGKYSCPSCNERHDLPKGGVDALRDAFLQKSLLEVASLIQRKPIPCSSSECKNDAKSACPTCGDFLCNDCESSHNRLRSTRNHEVTPIEELSDAKKLADFQRIRFDMCPLHVTKPCELYCKTDDTEMCNTCTFDPKHKGHDVITIEAKLHELNEEVKKIKATIDHNVVTLTERKEMVTQMLKSVKAEEKDSLEKLSARSKEISDMMQELTKKTENEIKTLSLKNQQYLQKELNDVEAAIKDCNKQSHQCTFLDSLPVPSSLKVAKDIIHAGQVMPAAGLVTEEALKKECPDIGLVLSTLGEKYVTAAWTSVVGFLSSSIRKDVPYDVLKSTMPDEKQAVAVAIVQDAVWQRRQDERRSNGYNAIGRLCSQGMNKKFPNEWNCKVGTNSQTGGYYYYGDRSFLVVVIDGIKVAMYARKDLGTE